MIGLRVDELLRALKKGKDECFGELITAQTKVEELEEKFNGRGVRTHLTFFPLSVPSYEVAGESRSL